jgi:hypothetical protein
MTVRLDVFISRASGSCMEGKAAYPTILACVFEK